MPCVPLVPPAPVFAFKGHAAVRLHRGVADVTTEVAALTAYRAHRRAQLLLGVHEEGRRIFPYEGRV